MGFEGFNQEKGPYSEIENLPEGGEKVIEVEGTSYKFWREGGELMGSALHESKKTEGLGPSGWTDAEAINDVGAYIEKEKGL